MIIAATDLSQDSMQALRWAQGLARKTSEKLRLLYVVEHEFYRMPGASALLDDPTNVKKLEKEIHREVSELLEGIDYEIDLREGTLLTELKDASSGADLLVLGSNPDSFSKFSLGSLPERLSHRPPLPIAVIGARDAFPPRPKWIVAVDFSQSSNQTIPRIAEMARKVDAELSFIHVVPVPTPVVVSNDAIMELESQNFSIKKAREWADERMERLIENHEEALSGVEFETRLVEGYPLLTLEEECRELNADAILVSPTGRSALGDVIMGSVAYGLVKRLPTNVILIPR